MCSDQTKSKETNDNQSKINFELKILQGQLKDHKLDQVDQSKLKDKFELIIDTINNLENKKVEEINIGLDLVMKELLPNLFEQDKKLLTQLITACNKTKNEIKYIQSRQASWLLQLGKYDIVEKKLGISDAGKVKELLKNPKSVEALYKGADLGESSSTKARRDFLIFLDERMNKLNTKNLNSKPIVTMVDFLGNEGLNLYKSAIEEESKSRAFRDAVFLHSIQHHKGPVFDKKVVLWVGGPSASGKTYAANGAFEVLASSVQKKFDTIKTEVVSDFNKLKETNPNDIKSIDFFILNIKKLYELYSAEKKDETKKELDNLLRNAKILFSKNPDLEKEITALLVKAKESFSLLTEGNYVVSIDGGVEREVSQMRQMLLQAALVKGYKGINDLHENTKLDIKDYVKKAALQEEALSLVIPETFVSSLGVKRFGSEGAYKEKEMQAYQNRTDIVQYFSEVTCEPGQEKRFGISVGYMGTTRAFSDKDFPEKDMKMNNRKLPCESKAYSSRGFQLGIMASKIAGENYKKMTPEGGYIKITNDLVFLKKISNRMWQECNGSDQPDIKLSNRDYQNWLKEKENNSNLKDLDEWLKEQKNLAPALIEMESNRLPVNGPVNNGISNMSISEWEAVEEMRVLLNKEEWSQAEEIAKTMFSKNKQDGNDTAFKIRKQDNAKMGFSSSYICIPDATVREGFKLYQQGEILGKGAEGKVKILRDKAGNELVVKTLADPKNPEDSKKLDAEIAMMKDLGVAIADFSRKKDAKYSKAMGKNIGNKRSVIMQKLPGKDLDKVILDIKNNKIFEPDQKKKILMEIALKISEHIVQLHDTHHIVHGDIKPENIRVQLNTSGEVLSARLMDYGCSVKLDKFEKDGDVYWEKKAQALGSPLFMPPELGGDAMRVIIQNANNEMTVFDNKMKKGDDPKLRTEHMKQVRAKMMSDLEPLCLKILPIKPSFDIYTFGVMCEKALGLDLEKIGLSKIVDPDPKERPSIVEVKNTFESQVQAKTNALGEQPRAIIFSKLSDPANPVNQPNTDLTTSQKSRPT